MLSSLSFGLFLVPSLVSAYSWSFHSQPRQCQNLSISIDGTGQPPYALLILPFGATPLPNNVEARTIVSIPFDGNTANFQLKYPSNSQFVAVVSDALAFGSGGTSVAAQVLPSDDSSCFNASATVQPQFVFSIEPPNQIVQCQPTRIWWDSSTNIQGTPNFLGVIPGGQSFQVPRGTITNVTSQGTGFSWTPSVRAGNTILLVGGDDRSPGNAGSALITVSPGINPNASCLNDQSPSSTPGSPAGGSYPTSSSGAGTGGGGGGNGGGNGSGGSNGGGNHGGGGSNTGAIVGGVVGGITALIAVLLLFIFLRRRDKFTKSQKERPVDLLQDDDDVGDEHQTAGNNELPPFYQPEPFMVPDPTVSSSRGNSQDGGRPLTMTSQTSDQQFGALYGARSPTPDASASTATRKSAAGPRMLRPINIVQHDDAGPSEDPAHEGEPETIELPPAYTNIKKPASAPQTGSEAAGDSST